MILKVNSLVRIDSLTETKQDSKYFGWGQRSYKSMYQTMSVFYLKGNEWRKRWYTLVNWLRPVTQHSSLQHFPKTH